MLMERLASAFGEDAVVEKGLHLSLGAWKIPRFIEEYLVIRECSGVPEEECSERVSAILRRFRPDPSEKNLWLKRLMDEGSLMLMDFYSVVTDIRAGIHRLRIPALDVKNAMVSPEVIDRHENLLRIGVWGIGRLVYDPEFTHGKRGRSDPILMEEFVPYQVSRIDLSRFASGRRQFDDEEWTAVLVQSLGLNPDAYGLDQRLLLLTRLAPLAEPNVNMMEFGPRATGKTFVYRNVSPLVRVIAGGTVSPALLFYNKVHRTVGLIGVMDCVVFDEVQYIRLRGGEEVVGKLKDYMASGHYERGRKQVTSGCSLVFVGNADAPVETGADLDPFLPSFARDPAFMDRVHGVLPGWRLPKIREASRHLARGPGLALDYLGAILHELRKVDASGRAISMLGFRGEATIRDQQAVVRLLSGMLKVLYPDLRPGPLARRAAELAVEMRRVVREWLAQAVPGEFGPDPGVEVRA